jgi:hypothetical protein
VVVTQYPPGSADHVFLGACRVSLSQQHYRVYHPLKRNEKENKIKYRKHFLNDLDFLFWQTKCDTNPPK